MLIYLSFFVIENKISVTVRWQTLRYPCAKYGLGLTNLDQTVMSYNQADINQEYEKVENQR